MATTYITAAQSQAFDAYTMNQIGIPSMVLMERAALAVAHQIVNSTSFDLNNVLVVAGTGNNGGDGVAVARLLHLNHIPVTIWLLGNRDHASEQTQQQLTIADHYNIPVIADQPDMANYTTVVDAIFGVGLSRDITGKFADVVDAINAAKANVMAVDMPTGLGTDDGQIMGTVVEATETVTMSYNKLGLATDNGRRFGGIVTVADIGIYDPATLTERKS
ncbi:YjeF protein [Furfurilactobacillus rossiae]|uniref:NAD(P)H-hydrate epimerase n=1 Tax=Furfurilactobacillus rossiae TaxID=231049 RepID=UPI0015BB1C05|nr:NAD(P)H-hydrate epimerase [Furfurilactobacillus rossiae]MCF6166105.1 NAD(P)H-hydrate epimerase [Furfurilactobacillus rossiae]QLE63237.1 YjeF protein [Furfurilactobacillus rossiae]